MSGSTVDRAKRRFGESAPGRRAARCRRHRHRLGRAVSGATSRMCLGGRQMSAMPLAKARSRVARQNSASVADKCLKHASLWKRLVILFRPILYHLSHPSRRAGEVPRLREDDASTKDARKIILIGAEAVSRLAAPEMPAARTGRGSPSRTLACSDCPQVCPATQTASCSTPAYDHGSGASATID